jgi:hypothetical protein
MTMMIATTPPPVVIAVSIIVKAFQDAIESEEET